MDVQVAERLQPGGRHLKAQDELTLRNNRRTAIALIPVLLLGMWMASVIGRHTVPGGNLSAAQIAASQCKLALLTEGTPCGPGGSGPYVPRYISMQLSDADLTVLANQRAQQMEVPVDGIVVHARGNDQIEGTANGHAAGQSVSFYFLARVNSPNDRPNVQVVSIQVGGLPGILTDQIANSVGQSLDIGAQLHLSQTKVAVSVGSVTVSGYR